MRPPLPLGAHGEIMLRKKESGKWVAREYYRANPTYSSAHYVPDLIDTLIGTGMRVGEALALRWEDLGGHQLRIYATMIITGAGGQIYQPHTKTKQERVVTLPPCKPLVGESVP